MSGTEMAWVGRLSHCRAMWDAKASCSLKPFPGNRTTHLTFLFLGERQSPPGPQCVIQGYQVLSAREPGGVHVGKGRIYSKIRSFQFRHA